MSFIKSCYIVIFVCLLSAGCAKKQPLEPPVLPDIDTSTAVDMPIYLATPGAVLEQRTEQIAKDWWDRHHIEVINIGDEYLISISNGLIYARSSPNILWSAYSILDELMTYLELFEHAAIRITVRSGVGGDARRAQALSKARARQVAEYFWRSHIDARIVYAKDSGQHIYGRAMNDRTEIIFRRVNR